MVDIVCSTKIRLDIYFATTMRYQEIVMLECTNAYGKVCPDVWGKLRRKSKIKFSCAKYRYGRFVVIAFSFEIDPEFRTEIEHLAEFYGILRAKVESPCPFFVVFAYSKISIPHTIKKGNRFRVFFRRFPHRLCRFMFPPGP